MTDKNLLINQISNRQYILSPAVQSGNDKESSNKDFYQEDVQNLGRLGLGMKVVHRKTQIPYTIINFEKEKVAKLNLQKKINSTLDLMYKSSHPYLFRLLNHFETEGHVFLIFEPFEGDSLDHIIQQGECDLQTALKYFVEILLGIQHMHTFGYYNLNVCPENVLIGECVKLTDYGLKMSGNNEGPKREIRRLRKGNLSYVVNCYHTPEEVIGICNGAIPSPGPKTDSWNCGILLFEMLTNFKSPFKGETDKKYIDSLINAEIDLSLINDEFCKDLISRLVKRNPEDRIDIEDILNIDYIKNINIEQPEIDPSDNIINPYEEEEEEEKMNDNDNENEANNLEEEDKDEIIKRLKAENEKLRKALELKQGLTSEEVNKNKLKPLESININKNGGVESKENINDKNANEKGPGKSADAQKEKNQIDEQKTLNILNNFEKLSTSKITNINELYDIIINSVNLFRESQQSLEGLIDKLIAISAEEHLSLIEENKKYIDNKGKLFFDTLESINNSGNKQYELEMIKEKEERKKIDKKKDDEIAELKQKYELSKQRESLLNEKIKALEERNNATKELNQRLMKKQEEFDTHFKLDKKNDSGETKGKI